MRYAAGVDVGSTYTKAVVMTDDGRIAGRAMARTGFRLAEMSQRVFDSALAEAGAGAGDVAYTVATGYGRFHVPFRDVQVTDLTACARGASYFCPGTRTVLDVGGQTMKATRLDAAARVRSFRLNDKCAAGTGAFLEKTARYLGYTTEEIGPLAALSHDPVQISGVCAVFAESEVINHLSLGASPADIMQGAIVSLVGRSVQLLKRVQMEPPFALVGGILRFPSMASLIVKTLGGEVNLLEGDMPQYAAAIGAAVLARRRAFEAAPERAAATGGERWSSAVPSSPSI
jgi:(R)-2-hydroxyacyl-CoA dehydratese activating ATPase